MVKTRQSQKKQKKTSDNNEKDNKKINNTDKTNKIKNTTKLTQKLTNDPMKLIESQKQLQKLPKIQNNNNLQAKNKLNDIKEKKIKEDLQILEKQYRDSQFLHKQKQHKSPQNFTHKNKYCKPIDQKKQQKIEGSLDFTVFSIVLKKNESQRIQLLQQLKSIKRLAQRNSKDLIPFLRCDWILFEDNFLRNKDMRKIISYITFANQVRLIKIKIIDSCILNALSHIGFENLKKLDISQTQIVNLQAMSWMNCPNLKEIQINGWMITSLKSLNKTNFTNCDRLYILNSAVSFSTIDRMKFSTQMGSTIRFMRNQQNRGNIMQDQFQHLNNYLNLQNVSLMCKLQGLFDALEISHHSKKMIKQRKAFLALKRKQRVNESDLESQLIGQSEQDFDESMQESQQSQHQ